MIDLHSHTDESDGTFSPADLVAEAQAVGLTALAITDHDTFKGYEIAAPIAREAGLELICGIELSTKYSAPGSSRERTVHLLGYWPDRDPGAPFTEWLAEMMAVRHNRNLRLVARLRQIGVNISMEEARAYGRSLTGRPHFARVLVEKGYASSLQDAFDRYLGESAPGYVAKDSPHLEEGVRRIAQSGGISSLAHPIRIGIRTPEEEEYLVGQLRNQGLHAIEAYHSDHRPADVERYLGYARKFGLLVTGGSDFHGANKPTVALGSQSVPYELLSAMRG